MKRRAFLAAIAGATLDPERLLWRPSAKFISIPRPPRVLLEPGDVFTIETYYALDPVTREVVTVIDEATGIRMRVLARFVATQRITEHHGDGAWLRRSNPEPPEPWKVYIAGD